MKLFKKFISLLIVLTMLPIAVFADNEDVTADSAEKVQTVTVQHNEEICKFLIALGIIDDTFGFQYEKSVSRMEFARVVVNVGGYSTEGYEPEGIFADVTEDNEYIADIELLYSLGIVSGDGVNFAPTRSITALEAITMLLRMAGYTDIVNISGGYPDGYIKIARNEGLLKNISSLESFVGDDMLVMVYNALMLKTVGFSQIGTFRLEDDETVLSQRHSVYYRKGIVSENDVTALSSQTTVGKNKVIVDTGKERVLMSVGDTDIYNKLGYRVTAYYRYDKMHDQSECVYYEFESGNDIKVIDIADVTRFTATDIEYTEGSRKKRVETSGAAIIYNDAYYQGPAISVATFAGKIGKITAVDNDLDNDCDVIVIEVYDTFVVGNATANNQHIYDKVTNAESDISAEGVSRYSLSMADGKDAVFGDICVDTVLSVSKSASGAGVKTVKVLVSMDRASGMVTGFDTEDGKTFIELDGITKYNVLDRVAPGTIPNVGSGATLLLDAFGNVAYVETKFLAESQYGFMIGFKYSASQDSVTVDLYTREGKIEKKELAEKSNIDGVPYKVVSDAEAYLSTIPRQAVNGGFLPEGVMPVRYKLNSDGKIRMIDTPVVGSGEDVNSLKLIGYGKNVFSAGTFGYTIPINGDTTVLKITTYDKTVKDHYIEEGTYTFQGGSTFSDKRVYTYNAYKLDPKSNYADFVMYFSSPGFDHDTPLTVVQSYDIKEYVEEEEDIFTVFKGMSEGKSVQCYISKDYEAEFMSLGLKKGDVIRCVYDDNDRLCDVNGPVFTYDSSTNRISAENTGDGTTDPSKLKSQDTSSAVIIGDVATRNEDLIKLYHMVWGSTYSSLITRSAIESDSNREVFWAKIGGSTPVTVYDAAEGNDSIYSGTYDNIVSMDNSFNNHSVVLLRFRTDALKEVIVINNLYN